MTSIWEKECTNCKISEGEHFFKEIDTSFLCETCYKNVGKLFEKRSEILKSCYHHTPMLGGLFGFIGKFLIDGNITEKRLKEHAHELIDINKEIEEINRKNGIK